MKKLKLNNSKALRLEMRKYGVRVVAIEPGWIRTPMVEQGVFQRDFANGRDKLQYPDAFPFDRVEFIRSSLKRELTEPSIVAGISFCFYFYFYFFIFMFIFNFYFILFYLLADR